MFDNGFKLEQKNENISSNLYDKDGNYINDLIKTTKNGPITIENITPIEETTTERKKIVKDSENRELFEISVDLQTNYGDENIKSKILPTFRNNFSDLKKLYNIKLSYSQSKSKSNEDEEESNNKIYTPKEEQSVKSNKIFEPKEEILFEKTPQEEKKIDSHKDSDTDNRNFNSDFFNYIGIKQAYEFSKLLKTKDKKFQENYFTFRGNYNFHAPAIYNNKECILLLYKNFLYIVEFQSKEKNKEKEHIIEKNIEQTLLDNLQKDESLNNIEQEILIIDYNLSHPLLCLNFDLLSCKILLNKKNENKEKTENNELYEVQILILGTSSKFTLFLKDYEIYKKFIYNLGSVIYNSNGYQINKLGLSLRTKKFYEDTYITVSEFESMAKTGDLLLFQTMECISDCQRLYTRDQYDHIACVILRNGIIEIFESTYNDNCNLLEWRRFKFNLYNLVFKKISLRRLNLSEENNSEKIEEKSIEFIEKVDKKKYNMSLIKMIHDSKKKDYEVKGEWDKAKGFCCSSLMAAFYIYIGVMKLEKSVHSVRPGDFEQDKNRLTILPGFSFGPEKIIEFST
jgi:hypothetical protein